MEFKPIKKQKKIYQTIIQQIKDQIISGKILPGEKLPSERAFADMFGVSRTSVKEAVTVLEASGIIRVKAGVGMFINEDSPQALVYRFSEILDERGANFENLIELRQAIEGDAAFYAAKRITNSGKEVLTEVYEELLQCEKSGLVAVEEDFAFHYSIVNLSNNPLMLEVFHLIADQMREHVKESREHSIKSNILNEHVMREHRNIYLAILEEKPEEARQAMWNHHENIKKRFIQRRLEVLEEKL